MKRFVRVAAFLLAIISCSTAFAQGDLAATLEVLQSGVLVRRVNTEAWLPVKVEAIVGVGDAIRTDASGRARVTFFADGTSTEILSNTEYHINAFSGDEKSFQLSVEIVVGQTVQRLQRLLDSNSSYQVMTPGMTLAARGTNFTVRVLPNDGRSAMLVSEGQVKAGQAANEDEVPPGFGIRADVGAGLSEVVKATSFDELDAALDGCTSVVSLVGDASLNVRSAPNTAASIIGYLAPDLVGYVVGRTDTSKWYRVPFEGEFGWIFPATIKIDTTCAGLRVFADDYTGVEEATQPG